MIVEYTLEEGQKPTKEQIEEVREAAQREIQFDEDCSELSPAMLKQLRCVVRQRNRWQHQSAGK